MKDYQALGIEGFNIPIVLGLVERRYGIKIETAWERTGKMIYHLRGQDWELRIKIDLNKEHNFIMII
jgi:hypothetical protein